MPEAIATTKRKFYKALDALTTSSQVSLPPPTTTRTPTSTQTVSSATAFDEARERARKRLRSSASSTSLTGLDRSASAASQSRPLRLSAAVPTASKSTKAAANQPLPNFSPWSQEMFLARLKTFSSVSKWHPKPDSINEVAWAKRGWSCVDLNTVACKGGCERRVLVSVEWDRPPAHTSDDDEDGDADMDAAALETALAEKYQDVIIDGHAESCLWHRAGCKDDIYRLQVIRPSVWQPELRKRFLSALAIYDAIANIKTRPLAHATQLTVPIDRLLTDLPAPIISPEERTAPGAVRALEIAMHGWRGSVESGGTQLLHCDACFQRIGLWMYQPGYLAAHSAASAANGDDGEDPQPETDPVATAAQLDLVEVHREHCPWRNAASQHAGGSLGGFNACQILQAIVSTCARDHRRRSDERGALRGDQQPMEGAEGLSAANGNGAAGEEMDGEDALLSSRRPAVSREEIARQDKERETRLRKLKNLFNIKRRTPKASSGAAA